LLSRKRKRDEKTTEEQTRNPTHLKQPLVKVKIGNNIKTKNISTT
jgi:hypothetical protein